MMRLKVHLEPNGSGRVELDGVDVTRHLTRLDISATVGQATAVRLHLSPANTVVFDGVIERLEYVGVRGERLLEAPRLGDVDKANGWWQA